MNMRRAPPALGATSEVGALSADGADDFAALVFVATSVWMRVLTLSRSAAALTDGYERVERVSGERSAGTRYAGPGSHDRIGHDPANRSCEGHPERRELALGHAAGETAARELPCGPAARWKRTRGGRRKRVEPFRARVVRTWLSTCSLPVEPFRARAVAPSTSSTRRPPSSTRWSSQRAAIESSWSTFSPSTSAHPCAVPTDLCRWCGPCKVLTPILKSVISPNPTLGGADRASRSVCSSSDTRSDDDRHGPAQRARGQVQDCFPPDRHRLPSRQASGQICRLAH